MCGVRLVHPFFTYFGDDMDVPAVAGIDIIAKANLVIDVRNKSVYSHHRVRLESAFAEYPEGPCLVAEDVATFVPVSLSATGPRTATEHKSVQTDDALVSQNFGGSLLSRVGAPAALSFDALERPAVLASESHSPLVPAPLCLCLPPVLVIALFRRS